MSVSLDEAKVRQIVDRWRLSKPPTVEKRLHEIKRAIDSFDQPLKPKPLSSWRSAFRDLPIPADLLSDEVSHTQVAIVPFSGVSVVGSFLLGTVLRGGNVDVLLTLGKNALEKTDFVRPLYHIKRAVHLFYACDVLLRKAFPGAFIEYPAFLDNCRLKPVAVVRFSDCKEVSFRIHVAPAVSKDDFLSVAAFSGMPLSAFRKGTALKAGEVQEHYGELIASDLCYAMQLSQLNSVRKEFPSFVDACILLKAWLRLYSIPCTINGFTGSVLLASAFKRGVFGAAASAWEAFYSTIRLIADERLQDVVAGTISGHDLLFSSYKPSLKALAAIASNFSTVNAENRLAMADWVFPLESLVPVFDFYLTLDGVLEGPAMQRVKSENFRKRHQSIGDLKFAFVDWVVWMLQGNLPADCLSCIVPLDFSDSRLRLGISLLPASQKSTIIGPPAANQQDAATFRAVWGDSNCKLQRFPDGTIRECVASAGKQPWLFFMQLLLARHALFSAAPTIERSTVEISNSEAIQETAVHLKAKSAFASLCDFCCNRVAMRVKAVYPLHPILRGCSVISSSPQVMKATALDVFIEFDASCKWPVGDDAEYKAFCVLLLLQIGMRFSKHRISTDEPFVEVVHEDFLFRLVTTGAALPSHVRLRGLLFSGCCESFPNFAPLCRAVRLWLNCHLLLGAIDCDRLEMSVARLFRTTADCNNIPLERLLHRYLLQIDQLLLQDSLSEHGWGEAERELCNSIAAPPPPSVGDRLRHIAAKSIQSRALALDCWMLGDFQMSFEASCGFQSHSLSGIPIDLSQEILLQLGDDFPDCHFFCDRLFGGRFLGVLTPSAGDHEQQIQQRLNSLFTRIQ